MYSIGHLLRFRSVSYISPQEWKLTCIIWSAAMPPVTPPYFTFQILPTVAFLFFFRTDSTDFPDCLPILWSMSVFYFLVFFVLCFLLVFFHAVDQMIYVGF